MLMFKVYLAGPIANQTFETSFDWREFVGAEIESRSNQKIKTYSPLREKYNLLPKGEILSCSPTNNHPLTTSRGIMTRDHNDCKTSDLIFVNLLGAKKISIGTVMEMTFAFVYKIPTVVVMETFPSDNPHEHHPMLQQTIDYRVNNLEDGVDIALSILL
jgi:nucleoside 2-deoxyribosyltransferase